MQKFKPVSNNQFFLLPPSVEDFIKEDHLARLVAEVVDNVKQKTRTSGKKFGI
jgi:transposase